LRQLYAQRHYAPLWSDAAGLSSQVAPILAMLCEAQNEGLDPHDYHLRALQTLTATLSVSPQVSPSEAVERLADVDLILSDAVLAYILHLTRGRWRPTAPLVAHLTPEDSSPLIRVLQEAGTTRPLPEVVAQFRPSHRGYVRLRRALAHYRRIAAAGGWPLLPAGPALRPGDRGLSVLLVKMRLQATGDFVAAGTGDRILFDAELGRAVRRFQRRHGLTVDGIIEETTRQALQVPVEERIRQLRLNLDRWRWLPRYLGPRHIWVNIPAYTLHVRENQHEVLSMRIVVGKPSWPTPLLHSTLPALVVNPAWNIPARIAREEILPLVQRDETYLARHNITVVPVYGAPATELSPTNFAWSDLSSERLPFRLRQEPGPSNALGRLKFLMPNPLQIYLHDTPVKSLFAEPERAASHGCIRLEKPLALASYLLREHPRWNRAALLEAIAAGDPLLVPFPTVVPIYVVYHTAWMSADGTVHFRPDIYGWDTGASGQPDTKHADACG
jgi:murein L,D-transpeptidase YcbB/YkuD